VAITLRQPAHMAALPTRRVHYPSRAGRLAIAGLISLAAAPGAILWRSDPSDEQAMTHPGRHLLH